MKRSLLIICICCFAGAVLAQNNSSSFKNKNRNSAGYTTSFSAVLISGQSRTKSTPVSGGNLHYQKLGSVPLSIVSKNGDNKKIIFGKDSITPVFIERKTGSNQKTSRIMSSKQRCFDFLNSLKQEMHISEPEHSFNVTDSSVDELGHVHIRLNQTFKGIKVYNSDFYVHFSTEREVMNGKYAVVNPSLSLVPKISADQALTIAKKDLSLQTEILTLTDQQKRFLAYDQPKSSLVILDDKKSLLKSSLVYHIVIKPNVIDEWYYFVDASNGSIVNKFNNTKYDGPATATAPDLNGVNRTLNTYLEKGSYSLIDAAEPMFNAAKNEGMIITLDAQNSNGTKYAEITTTNNNWTTNPKAVSAHFNAKQAYLYFKNTFDRNSINGSGGNIFSFINVANADGSGMDNAFWSDKIMFYGNGNVAFKPLAGGLDVAAHEMAHGVTQNSAALEYQGESGAMNESFSDIFGSMVDRANWYIGELVTKTSYIASGRLRDMSNPHNGTTSGFAGWQPMHTSEMYHGTEDNGGVHMNSGIINYAYYQIATAITKEKAEQLFYRTLTKYLTKSSQFLDLRIGAIQAAKDLYGETSNEVTQVKTAFDAVGIYEEQPNTYVETYPENPGAEYLLMDNTDPADANSLYKSNADASGLVPLSKTKMKGKISVVDNGAGGVFVSTDNKIRRFTLGSSNTESVISPDAIWENVAISKDGNRLAAITTEVDTAIYVYDFVSAKWAKFHLYNPTTDGGQGGGGVLYADALEFDHTGEYLVYDSYNLLKSNTSDSISYWDIGVINVWDNHQNKFGDGTINKLFGNIPDSVSIGNPVFSKNSPNVIAFDYVYGDNVFAVLGLNIETMELDVIAVNNTIGFPSFSKSDTKIAFTALDNSDQEVINTVELNSNKISSSVDPVTIIQGAQWPVYYATGTRVLGFAPKANFTASFKSGKVPLSTTFIDQSTNEPTSWEWTFESGNPHTSTSQNPVVSYASAGTYAVTLKVTNGFGNNSVVKSGFITVTNATGVSDVESEHEFFIYPNPSDGTFWLSLKDITSFNYKIEVFNQVGQLVKSMIQSGEEVNTPIDLSGLPSGLYILKIKAKDKTYQARVLKQ